MSQHPRYYLGFVGILVASVLWGTTGTVASFAPAVSPLAIGAFAMGGAGVLLFFHALGPIWKVRRLLGEHWLLLGAGGLAVVCYPLAFYTAMRWSGVALGTVVSIASAPLFAVLLEYLISKKRFSLYWLISFLLGAAGILFLVLGQQEGAAGVPEGLALLGALLGLIAGLTYALYSWSAKCLIELGVPSRAAMAAMFGLAALVLLPSLLITGDNLFATGRHTQVALYMALVPMFIGYLCFSYGLRYVEASRATLITLLEPVVAVLLAVGFLGERFSVLGWLGVFLILLSLLSLLAKKTRGD